MEKSTQDFPILAIVVPVSNMAGKLGKLEKWLLASEGYPIEIFLVHDFKDLQTQAELERLVIRSQNKGVELSKVRFGNPGETRNFALERISAPWVQFVDSDDEVIVANSLQAIHERKENSTVLITNYTETKFFDEVEITRRHNHSLLNISLNPGIWRMIFKKETVSKVRFSRYRMGEDQLFLLDLNLFRQSIEFSEIVTYRYTTGGQHQLTNSLLAISEVKEVIFEIADRFPIFTQSEKKYVSIMATRLIITLLKNESLSSVQSAARLLLDVIARFSIPGRISLLCSLITIALRKNP